MNANVLHHWLNEQASNGSHASSDSGHASRSNVALKRNIPALIPVQLPTRCLVIGDLNVDFSVC